MINKKRLVELTQKLISIDSQNPPGDESKIAVFVRDYLKRLGLNPKIYEFEKKRSNIVALWEGSDQKHSLMLTPHLDTVPSGNNWSFPPFGAKIHKKRIYGLGATDCKGNVACAIEAINSLIEEKRILWYNLIFAATADEESGSKLGLEFLLDKGILKPDAALVLDSDDFSIIVAQKGLIHLKIIIEGKRAHGAYPWLGINAIDIAIGLIRKLQNYRFSSIKNKYLRPPTLNIGTIHGGDKVNVVADWCEFELDFRFLPGDSSKNILRDIKGVIEKTPAKFKIEIEGIQEPFSIDEKHPLVESLAKAMHKIRVKPGIKGSEGATTISFFQDRNIPSIAAGFGTDGCAHIVDEYAGIDDLYQGARVLEEFLKTYRLRGERNGRS